MNTTHVEFRLIHKRRTFKVYATKYSNGWLWSAKHLLDGNKGKYAQDRQGMKASPTVDEAQKVLLRQFETIIGEKP